MPTKTRTGFSLAEMVLCMIIVSLITALALFKSKLAAGGSGFHREAYHIVELFRDASVAASQSERRYGILFDFIEYSYTLYEIKTDEPYSENFETLLEDDVIERGSFSDYCQLLYVVFDDGEYIDGASEQGKALFLVGHGDWDYGGKVVLSDLEGNLYSIVVNRLGNNPALEEGDVELLVPQYDLTF
ncbi:MAG: prepilin-type N-terminal cleavage/methylation domain-containing protein [Phycisphaerae bacterium]